MLEAASAASDDQVHYMQAHRLGSGDRVFLPQTLDSLATTRPSLEDIQDRMEFHSNGVNCAKRWEALAHWLYESHPDLIPEAISVGVFESDGGLPAWHQREVSVLTSWRNWWRKAGGGTQGSSFQESSLPILETGLSGRQQTGVAVYTGENGRHEVNQYFGRLA